jgi:hypothetical protein
METTRKKSMKEQEEKETDSQVMASVLRGNNSISKIADNTGFRPTVVEASISHIDKKSIAENGQPMFEFKIENETRV